MSKVITKTIQTHQYKPQVTHMRIRMRMQPSIFHVNGLLWIHWAFVVQCSFIRGYTIEYLKCHWLGIGNGCMRWTMCVCIYFVKCQCFLYNRFVDRIELCSTFPMFIHHIGHSERWTGFTVHYMVFEVYFMQWWWFNIHRLLFFIFLGFLLC